jgi:serine protease AprX
VRALRVLAVAVGLVAVLPSRPMPVTAAPGWPAKLDAALAARAGHPGRSRIIVRTAILDDGGPLSTRMRAAGARITRALPLVNGVSMDVPNALLPLIASDPLVDRVSSDRLVVGAMERTRATIGAGYVREQLGYDGSGVGVAVIDSGVNATHDDLSARAGIASRVVSFVDFVNGRAVPYDDFGHGTHVAGIVAGDGYDSEGAQAGIAPGAHLVVLKVLDATGRGRISDVIAALEYAVSKKDELHIRVVNLSVATGVYESYDTDPLTQAAKRAVEAGLVVVAAAGNNGRGQTGLAQYGGITAPGNAPWVLTVGASSHMGTVDRADDTMAAFSSRGPGAIDLRAKPDLTAPGVGTESLADPASALYASPGAKLIAGTVPTSYFPYMSLSGTSMSAPVVAATVALMLQANPALTPNAVKAVLHYTAQPYPGYDALTQGAGFLNARGAVELAAYLAAPSSRAYPSTAGWSTRIIWGNHVAQGGRLTADANAWALNVTWGDVFTASGDRLRWGLTCADSSCLSLMGKPWQSPCMDAACRVVNGDPANFPNVVWGSLCAGADCAIPWRAGTVTATSDPEADTVVWGTTSDIEGDTVVWGTVCTDPACDAMVWNWIRP